jgi:hypothetical protein
VPGAAPAAPAPPRSAGGATLAPVGTLAASGGPRGLIAIAGSDPRRPGRALAVEGRARGPFAALPRIGARAGVVALAGSYLGDLALLSPAGGGLALEVQRWFGGPPGPPRLTAATGAAGAPAAATVALDYRSDAIVAWASGGSLWVSDLLAGRAPGAPQRLGQAGTRPRIAALLSDDERGMVMWSVQTGGTTSVWFDYSARGPRFGAPRLLERAADPGARASAPGAPELIRLSSESVMAAWNGVQEGRWAVRTAPVDQHGVRTIGTISAPRGDALLAALAPGPSGDAVALLREPQGAADGGPGLLAASGFEADGKTTFGAAEAVAEDAATSSETVALEPGDDRAVAAWQGDGGAVFYSLRGPAADR